MPGSAGVDAVGGLAGGDVETSIERHVALADVAEARRVLQLELVGRRDRHGRRRRGELAVAELAARRLVHDLVVLRLDLADRHAPAAWRAACSSICRAAAPHRRIGWMKWRMLREPSVSWLP